jgi:aldose 1-epimerase
MNCILRQYVLSHSSGEDIYLFTLRNEKETEVNITNYGAIITAFKIKKPDGRAHDIVLGLEKVEDYWSAEYLQQYPWLGAAVGRYANRIKNATFPLEGKIIHVSANQGSDQLHGGHEGFDRKVWQIVSFGHYPCLFLELKYLSPDGEEGYPGNLEVVLRFELSDNDELSYRFTATTDKVTAVNLTHHSYFNLNNGEGTIQDHELRINADRVLQQGQNLVATGAYENVSGTAYDFRDFRVIGEGLKEIEEYDKSYETAKDSNTTPVLVAELRNRERGINLQVFSTEPVVHFYSGKWIPPLMGKNNIRYGAFSGLCLETHKHPNAVNIPAFPNTILRPGEVYYQETVYRITHV